MTRDDIIRHLLQAADDTKTFITDEPNWSLLMRFAALVVVHEREAAAKECETLLPSKRIFDQRYYEAVEDCVATIRERGEK